MTAGLGLGSGTETLLFSLGGGGLLGYLAAKALRVIARIAAVIIGAFILGLAFLSYKGCITAHWDVNVQNQTESYMYNVSAQVLHALNDTVSRYTVHPSLISAEGTPIAAGAGFTMGLALGIRR